METVSGSGAGSGDESDTGSGSGSGSGSGDGSDTGSAEESGDLSDGGSGTYVIYETPSDSSERYDFAGIDVYTGVSFTGVRVKFQYRDGGDYVDIIHGAGQVSLYRCF